MNEQAPSSVIDDLRDAFAWVLSLALIVIPPLAAHQDALHVWTYESRDTLALWGGFRSVTLHRGDFPALLALVMGMLLFVFSANVRRSLLDSARRIGRDYGGVFWGVLGAWGLVTILWADIDRLALYQSLHLFGSLALAWLLADAIRRQGDSHLYLGLILAAVFYSILALAQVITGASLGLDWLGEIQRAADNPFGYGPEPFRGYGLSFHPSNLAGFLALAIIAMLMLIRRRVVPVDWRIPLLIGLGVVGIGLLATVSRATLIAGAMISPLILLYAPPVPLDGLFQRRVMGAGAVMLVTGLALIVLLGGDFATTLKNKAFELPEEAVDRRLAFGYQDTLTTMEGEEILGLGFGNLMTEQAERPNDRDGFLVPVHNAYVYIWSELGVMGLLLFALATLWVLASIPDLRGSPGFVWGIGLLGVNILMLVEFYWWGHPNLRMLYFWAIGVWWGLRLRADDASRQT